MTTEDRVALLIIAEVLAEHLEKSEDDKDKKLLPSDRVRGAINTLVKMADQ
jgi:hypothetical protein